MPSRPRHSQQIQVLDLFAGPGGLSEGFSSLEVRGRHPFHIALSAEKDPWAQQTLELRAFYRQFLGTEVPAEYWRHLSGKISRQQLFESCPKAAAAAREHSRLFELNGANRLELEARIDALRLNGDRTIVIGGPPCQAYSVAGRSRNSAKPGWRLETDSRSQLYLEYLHVLRHVQPAAFVMENVRGLLSARMHGVPLFGTILRDLKSPAGALGAKRTGRRYHLVPLGEREGSPQLASDDTLGVSPESFLVRAEEHGVPQARHRVIILGVAEDLYDPSRHSPTLAKRAGSETVRAAIGHLPRVRSALSSGGDGHLRWVAALRRGLQGAAHRGASADVRRAMKLAVERAGARDPGRGAEFTRETGNRTPVLNHLARTHMEADLHRYLFASSFAKVHGKSPTLRDFPDQLLPDHSNVRSMVGNLAFNDRFRVQCWGLPSTTIVSHIAKDGHYYIHPDAAQCRSLTVREAAELQTFPRDYLFCGPKTAQYQQVGNAVPVLLARQVASLVNDLLG